MALQAWTPALELSAEIRHQFDDVIERHFGHPAIRHSYAAPRTAPIEYYKEGEKLVVRVDVPGVDPKAIEVTPIGEVLKISGEREDKRHEKKRDFVVAEVTYGRFECSVRVPPGLEGDKITATYDKGILTLVIALLNAKEPHQVPVQTATGNQADNKPAKKMA